MKISISVCMAKLKWLLPMFITEGNVQFQLEVSENKEANLSSLGSWSRVLFTDPSRDPHLLD